MEIRSKEIEMVSINTPVPYEKNMHIHTDEQIDRLVKLIEYQGFRNPLVLQKGTNRIAAGHGRLEAAKKMGMKDVPVIYQEFESEEQFYAYVVSDNAIGKNDWAKLDYAKINVDLMDLGPDLDIDLLGLKDFSIEPMDAEFPDLGDGSDPDIQQVTFTISNEQRDFLDQAMSKARKELDCTDEINKNSNGNTLGAIAKHYVS